MDERLILNVNNSRGELIDIIIGYEEIIKYLAKHEGEYNNYKRNSNRRDR
jgi:hypothetical protein